MATPPKSRIHSGQVCTREQGLQKQEAEGHNPSEPGADVDWPTPRK